MPANSKTFIVVGLAVLAKPLSPAHAQLATSPDAVLPEVMVVEEGNSTTSSTKRASAPSAAQQKSTPRSRSVAVETVETTSDPGDASSASAAQQVDDGTIVSATGVPRPVDVTASSVTVVTAKEIQAQQRRTLPDVLRSVPGLSVVQSGGPGTRTSVFIRGTESDHVKVIIDGIDVTDPGSGGRTFDFGQLLTNDIERIEVLRGPQSGLYGADALGGAIVVYTKKGEGPPKATATVEGGSFGTFNQTAGLSGSADRFNYAFNAGHFRSSDIPVTPGNILSPGTPRFDNDYENWSFSTKLGYDFSDALSVNVVARYTDSDLDFTGDTFDAFFNARPEPFQTNQKNEQLFTRGEVVLRSFGGAVTSFFGVNYSDTNIVVSSPSMFQDSTGDRLRFDWRSVVTVSRQVVVTVGADQQTDTLHTLTDDAEEDNAGVYGQILVEPIRNLTVAGNVRHDENENFGGATTWRVAPSYTIEATGTILRGSVGTAFKAPSLIDRFVDFPAFFFFANRDLQPEENFGYDLGFEQAVFDGQARFGATYFKNDITDLIEFFVDPITFVSTVRNLGSAQTEGVEVFASADLTDDIRVRADYTFTETENGETGLQLLRRPRHKASFNVGWTPTDRLLLTGQLLYIGEAEDVDRVTFATVTRDDYILVNVAGDYRINDNLSLFGRIDNLFDTDYQDPPGFEGLGLGAYVGMRVTN